MTGDRTSQPLAEKFGRYTILRPIAHGGMASTELALRKLENGTEIRCAIKKVHSFYSHDPEFKRMFIAEAEISALLQHANIVRLLDAGSVGETLFIAMDYVEGTDLRGLIQSLKRQDRVLSPGIVCQVALDVASAMAYAHGLRSGSGKPLGIIHRDISPGNILIGEDGVSRLADFGIARAIGVAGRTLTAEGSAQGLRGKFPYSPIEQHGSARDLDARADIFAFGVTLYEALVGVRPFDPEGETEWMTITKIQKGDYIPIHVLAPHAPRPLLDIIDKCIRTKRDERFSSANEIIHALDACSPPASARLVLGQIVHYFYRSERASADPHNEPLSGPVPSGFDEIRKLPKVHPHYTFDEKRAVFPDKHKNPDTNVLASDTQLAAVAALAKITSDDGPTERIPAPAAPTDTRSGTRWTTPFAEKSEGKPPRKVLKKKQRKTRIWPFVLGGAVLLLGISIGLALVYRPVAPENQTPQEPTQPVIAHVPTPAPPRETPPEPHRALPVADSGTRSDSGIRTQDASVESTTAQRPAPTTAMLVITVVPHGDVYVDNDRATSVDGRARVRVSPGRHELEARAGELSVRKTVTVQAGETHREQLHLPMQRRPGLR